MPRHNPDNTPTEKRRAPKGSRVGTKRFEETAASVADFHALKERWKLNDSEVVRKALSVARESGL